MKRISSNKVLSLSAVALLVVAILVIVIRRRGRKVPIAEPYRLNEAYDIYLYALDLDHSTFYRGTLGYVVMPYGWEKKFITVHPKLGSLPESNKLYPVIGVGYRLPSGKLKRVMLKETAYIDGFYIGIGEE